MMNLFYLVWDYIDEKLFDKRNTSDCAQFSELLGWPTACKSYIPPWNLADNVAWAMFWFGYEALVFTAAIFAGIIVFRVSYDPLILDSNSG
jgi:hypothetical protein